MLFVPGHKEKYFNKLDKINPDCFIFDLEDSVPDDKKNTAIEKINKNLSKKHIINKDIFVRVNKTRYKVDILSIHNSSITGIVLPKINKKNELIKILEFIKPIYNFKA